jgi:RecA-family ATPase
MQIDTKERARRWLAKVPPSISGQNGHSQAFVASTGLVHGFELSEQDALALLEEWNRACKPPWSQRELLHKVREAATKPHSNPRGWLKVGGHSALTPVSPIGKFIVCRSECLPPEEDSFENMAEKFLRHCFEPDELVCICTEMFKADDGRSGPANGGIYLKRDEWLEKHFSGKTNPLFLSEGFRGAYVRINPCSDTSGTDSGVSIFRHVLIEMDERTKEEQWAILKDSRLPLSVVIDSGGKSLHGWVRVNASSREEWQQRRDVIYKHIEHLGVDPKNKNASRFSRLPGVMRDGKQQRLVAVNQGCGTWDEFIDHLETIDLPKSIGPAQILAYDPENDPDNLIGDRWLRRGSSLLFVGQSGVGKSTMLLDQAMKWAFGIPWYGISPKRRLKIIFVQAENDIADLYDQYTGAVRTAFGNRPGGDVIHAAKTSGIEFFRETVKTGEAFTVMLRKLIKKTQADVVYVDPLLSYIGGDISKQEVASKFLRNMLQPILLETGAILVVAHHFPKPKGKDSQPESIADMAYSGMGSSELTNWAREVCVLKEIGMFTPRKFLLGLTKRGKRSGMQDANGNSVGQICLQHGTNSLTWDYAETPKFKVDTKGKRK